MLGGKMIIKKYVTLSLGLFMISSGLAKAAEVISPIEQQPASYEKLSDKVKELQGGMMSSQDPARTIEELRKNDFFKLTVKCDDIYNSGNYKKAALYFIACALDPEMGEMHENTLYKINSESLDWIKSNDFSKLTTLLPALEKHLQKKHQEEKSAEKVKPDMMLSQEAEESFVEIE